VEDLTRMVLTPERETRVLAFMLGLQWYDQTSEHSCSPSTVAVRAPMAAAEARRAGYWHEHPAWEAPDPRRDIASA